MIERLLVALRYFSDGASEGVVDEAAVRRAAGDFLDAYRLIVDCPQYELGATARAALADVEVVAERLGDDGRDPIGVRGELAQARVAADRALTALGAGRG